MSILLKIRIVLHNQVLNSTKGKGIYKNPTLVSHMTYPLEESIIFVNGI